MASSIPTFIPVLSEESSELVLEDLVQAKLSQEGYYFLVGVENLMSKGLQEAILSDSLPPSWYMQMRDRVGELKRGHLASGEDDSSPGAIHWYEGMLLACHLHDHQVCLFFGVTEAINYFTDFKSSMEAFVCPMHVPACTALRVLVHSDLTEPQTIPYTLWYPTQFNSLDITKNSFIITADTSLEVTKINCY